MLKSLLPRIMGFLVIILVLALGPSIYTANTDIVGWVPAGIILTGIEDFLGMEVVAGFGAFIIILGLLVSGGVLAMAGVRGKLAGASMSDIMKVIGSVIIVVIMLTLMVNILNSVETMMDAASTAGDDLGYLGFSIIPIIIYVGIIAAAGWAQASAHRSMRKGSKRAVSARSMY